MELSIDVIQRAQCRLVLNSGSQAFATDNAVQSRFPHQALHCAAGDVAPCSRHLPPDLAQAIDLEGLLEDAGNLGLQDQIPRRPRQQSQWIVSPCNMFVISGRGNRQNLANRLDPMGCAIIVDKRDHLLNRWSSSAIFGYGSRPS